MIVRTVHLHACAAICLISISTAIAQFPGMPNRRQQELNAQYSEETGCKQGTAGDCDALGSYYLTFQHASGLDLIHFHIVGQCLLRRAAALKQHDSCANTPGMNCVDITAELQKELSWDTCQQGEVKPLSAEAAAGFAPNPNPGCSGTTAIEARNGGWQSPTSLSKNQTITIWIPPGNSGPQSWSVIDPGHRGANSAIGNGVPAGDGFIRPGFPEGALLVRGGDQVIRHFDKPDGILSFSAPPGQVAFIANDNYKNNGHPIPPGFGFYGNGFDDNSGSITVKWSLSPCPIPAIAQPVQPPPIKQGSVQIIPSGSCNQTGTQMFLFNGTDHLITAIVRRDINGVSGNITIALNPRINFPWGCTVGLDASQWSWNLISVQ
jgi:hypothetical protein